MTKCCLYTGIVVHNNRCEGASWMDVSTFKWTSIIWKDLWPTTGTIQTLSNFQINYSVIFLLENNFLLYIFHRCKNKSSSLNIISWIWLGIVNEAYRLATSWGYWTLNNLFPSGNLWVCSLSFIVDWGSNHRAAWELYWRRSKGHS